MPETEPANKIGLCPNTIIERQKLESLTKKLKEGDITSYEMAKLLSMMNEQLKNELPRKKYSDTNHQTKDKSDIGDIADIVLTLKENRNKNYSNSGYTKSTTIHSKG